MNTRPTRTESSARRTSQSGRNYGLDLLRALSIVIVLSNHCFLGFFVDTGRVAWEGTAAGISTIAVLAIEWLFVLSGFLIGAMMIRSFEAGATWWQRARDFWLRRWFRTVPNYYLFLLVNALLSAIGIGSGVFSYEFVLFSQNLAWPEASPLFFGEAWSLALDEWFYFLMPLLLGLASWVFRLGSRTAFIAVATSLIVVPTVARFIAIVPTDFFDWDANIRRVTIFHLDATGWGVLSAISSRWLPSYWENNRKSKAALGGLLTVAGLLIIETQLFGGWPASLVSRTANLLSLTLPAAGAILILPWLTSLSAPREAMSAIVDRISLYSYSLYLCHFPMLFIVKALFAVDRTTSIPALWFVSVVWLLGTVSLSGLVYASFEKPVSDLRERYTRRVNASPF